MSPPYDQQAVSDPGLFLGQAVSSIMSHITNRLWVTLVYIFARESHQLSHIWPTECEWRWFISLPGSLINHVSTIWPTGSEWHWFISLPGSLINHLSSYDQQHVSDTVLFLCQAASLIISHPMANREWVVTLVYFFARQSHQYLILYPTVCEWYWFISLPGSLINHVSSYDQLEQEVSDAAILFTHYFTFTIPWQTGCKS